MRLTVEIRELIGTLHKKGYTKKSIADIVGKTVKTVSKWCKRKRLKDWRRRPRKSKLNADIINSIVIMKSIFEWGTAKIQQNLLCAPEYVKEAIPYLPEGIKLSRQTINNILKKRKLNGYKRKHKPWKFFRAKCPNELWQIDLKGPVIIGGKKLYFIVCIDDYSRYLLLLKYLDYMPGTQEVFDLLRPLIKKYKPENILSDNGQQFKKYWAKLCRNHKVEPLFAHPYYPQDKGKVERAIRTVNEEFIKLLRKFPEWLAKIKEYVAWYNLVRFHRGVQSTPSNIYLEK